MTTRENLTAQNVAQSLAPAARVTGTATGTTVDLRGYDSATVVVAFGACTDGTHTPSVLQSTDGTTWTACAYGTDLSGPSNLTAVTSSSGANAIQQVAYIGNCRYIAAVITTTDATTGALSAANVVLGHPHNVPTM